MKLVKKIITDRNTGNLWGEFQIVYIILKRKKNVADTVV